MAILRRHPPEPTIADECEAFLAGGSWQLHERSNWPVPPWARLNRLARGSYEDLIDAAGRTLRPGRSASLMTWDTVLTLLAQQLLADADDASQLASRQARALVPLEPMLFDPTLSPTRPDEFFEFVVHHLAQAHRDDQDHL